MNRQIIFSIGILCLLTACIDGIEVFSGDNRALVIEGTLTNNTAGHIVKVYYTTKFNVRPEYVETAEVSIIDDLGNIETLKYDEYGKYETQENFVGEYGRTYQLVVSMSTGATYSSAAICLQEPPEINRVWFERGTKSLNVFAEFADPENVQNYYRWR